MLIDLGLMDRRQTLFTSWPSNNKNKAVYPLALRLSDLGCQVNILPLYSCYQTVLYV